MSTSLRFNTEFSLAKTSFIIRDLIDDLIRPANGMVAIPRGDNSLVDIGHSVSYDASRSALDVKLERQAYAFYQKNAAFDLGIDTKTAALTTFLACEEKCKIVNNHIRARRPSNFYNPMLLEGCRRIIAKILGPRPRISELQCGFGPGANVGVSRLTSIRRKLNAVPTITSGAMPYLNLIRMAYPQWSALSGEVAIQNVGKIAFVPKNAKTDRPIGVEPLVNSFVQKGIGSYLKARLKANGINLYDQSRNQYLARKGSMDGSLCTIDLSSASDTISLELVKALLPADWYDMLYAFRTVATRLDDGRVIALEKFSSMGNGYTFELESLIFYAITRYTCGKAATISVYGDDIICPSEHFTQVSRALESCGFSVNSEKSFSEGLFRESCGRDFFGGVSVRPCYLKGLLSVKELFRLHNFFFREGMQYMCATVLKYIPKRFRCYGPDGFGDGHLLTDRPLRSYGRSTKHVGGFTFHTWCTKPRICSDQLPKDYEAWLYLTTHFVDPDSDPYSAAVHRQYSRPWSMTPANISRSMYYERGGNRYRQIRVYFFSE